MEWTKGYPEANVDVLLTDGEDVEIGYYDGHDNFYSWDGYGLSRIHDDRITHFQHLPSFPEPIEMVQKYAHLAPDHLQKHVAHSDKFSSTFTPHKEKASVSMPGRLN